jgi:hypothetical protein
MFQYADHSNRMAQRQRADQVERTANDEIVDRNMSVVQSGDSAWLPLGYRRHPESGDATSGLFRQALSQERCGSHEK